MCFARFDLVNTSSLVFKPKAPASDSAINFTSVASHIPHAVLAASPALSLLWRVAFYEEVVPPEYSPVKPLWFLKGELHLAKANDAQRVA